MTNEHKKHQLIAFSSTIIISIMILWPTEVNKQLLTNILAEFMEIDPMYILAIWVPLLIAVLRIVEEVFDRHEMMIAKKVISGLSVALAFCWATSLASTTALKKMELKEASNDKVLEATFELNAESDNC